ncbi:hypothetical protein [Nostoc sp.]|uniref:hypothetical protein n=1 Tax=Nostoc sp. TaxID=1180 RepID=UPI003593B517
MITYQEQVRVQLNILSRAKTLDEQILDMQGLQQLAGDYQSPEVQHKMQANNMPYSRWM